MSSMTVLPTLVFPFQGVLLFPPESAPVATKSLHATPKGLIEPLMFGPNITGEALVCQGWSGPSLKAGALSLNGTYNAPGGGATNGKVLKLNASSSKSIYGSASTVQPSSLRCTFCIKT